jgi:hypothetical protein
MLAFVRSLFFRPFTPYATSSKEDIPNEPKPKIIILPKGRHVLTPTQLITLTCQDHKMPECSSEARVPPTLKGSVSTDTFTASPNPEQ